MAPGPRSTWARDWHRTGRGARFAAGSSTRLRARGRAWRTSIAARRLAPSLRMVAGKLIVEGAVGGIHVLDDRADLGRVPERRLDGAAEGRRFPVVRADDPVSLEFAGRHLDRLEGFDLAGDVALPGGILVAAISVVFTLPFLAELDREGDRGRMGLELEKPLVVGDDPRQRAAAGIDISRIVAALENVVAVLADGLHFPARAIDRDEALRVLEDVADLGRGLVGGRGIRRESGQSRSGGGDRNEPQ